MSEHRWVIRTLSAPQRRLMPPMDIDDATFDFETRDRIPDETYVISRADCLHAPLASTVLTFGDLESIETVDLSHILPEIEDDLLRDALTGGGAPADLALTERVIDLEDPLIEYLIENGRRYAMEDGIDETPRICLSYNPEAVLCWLKEMRPYLHAEIKGDIAKISVDTLSARGEEEINF